jgi:mono/diheme cytochrome c family protein
MGNLVGTPRLNEGRELLSSLGCAACHRIVQPDGNRMMPTDFPPQLTHIAEKTTREWIYAWVKNPQAYSATAIMPNFQFTDDEARAVAAFLIAQSTPSGAAGLPAAAALKDAEADGKTLYGESFCASCHAIQNEAGTLVGGNFGPELTGIGSKVKPEWLSRWLADPAAYEPGTRMPHFRFDAKQIGQLSAFLLARTNSDFVPPSFPATTPDQIAEGKRLVGEYGCAACHQINGVAPPQNFAPDLTSVGSKPLSQIVFTPDMPQTLPDYIATKIKHPRVFIPGLKMPQFTLSNEQVDALTTALLAQNDRAASMPISDRVAVVRSSDYQPAGTAGKLMRELRCLSCHSVNGNGGSMAPDLSWEGSSVQRAWLTNFLANPNTLRPALIRRMPKFNLSPAEIATLSDYILQAYQRPGLAEAPAGLQSPELIAQGKQLFYSKYDCQSCHIIDFNTDKGYIGPQLAQVGARLTPEWIYNWLKAPQSLRPGTLEPDQHMTDDDARALTAYLVSLKSAKKEVAKR